MNDDYLNDLCSNVLETRSVFIQKITCVHCKKDFHFADGTFGITENTALVCCPYCDTYDYRMCNLKETIMKRKLFWR